jgi:uncharacterized membrane protein YphA (DoxX/SURF4 family)
LNLKRAIVSTNAPAAIVLIRLMVGGVFLSEGIHKFLLPGALGAGRFAKIGIPAPELTGPFVGAVEIVAGSMILAGFFTRLACAALLIDISVAIVATKIPVLLGHAFAGLALPKLERYGFWSMLHEARTDLCMWLGLVYLLIAGAGRWSIDRQLAKREGSGPGEPTWK